MRLVPPPPPRLPPLTHSCFSFKLVSQRTKIIKQHHKQCNFIERVTHCLTVAPSLSSQGAVQRYLGTLVRTTLFPLFCSLMTLYQGLVSFPNLVLQDPWIGPFRLPVPCSRGLCSFWIFDLSVILALSALSVSLMKELRGTITLLSFVFHDSSKGNPTVPPRFLAHPHHSSFLLRSLVIAMN